MKFPAESAGEGRPRAILASALWMRGFFSAEANGNVVYLNATLAN